MEKEIYLGYEYYLSGNKEEGYSIRDAVARVVIDDIREPVAESLANALLDDLGKGWKKYPENEPEYDGGDDYNNFYEVTVMREYPVGKNNYFVTSALWMGNRWAENPKVVAFKRHDAPFQPEEK